MDPSLVSSEDNLANQISYQSNANPFYQSVNLMTIRQYHANPLTSTHTSSIESQAWCLYAKVFCHTNFGELLLGSRVHLIILWPLSVQFDLENQLHFSFGYPLRRISRPCFSDSSLLCSSTRYYSFHLGFLHFACVLFIQTILMILQSGTSIGLGLFFFQSSSTNVFNITCCSANGDRHFNSPPIRTNLVSIPCQCIWPFRSYTGNKNSTGTHH